MSSNHLPMKIYLQWQPPITCVLTQNKLSPFVKGTYFTLGTDGFGRSDSRKKLREYFEVDANNIAATAAYALLQDQTIDKKQVGKIYEKLGINKDKSSPWVQ